MTTLLGQPALAFAAGMLTVAAPCVLPMLPIVLGGAVSGAARLHAQGGAGGAGAATARRAAGRRPLFITAGFVASFAAFTLVFSAFSSLLGLSPDALRDVAVAGLLLFGALMVWRTPLEAFAARSGGFIGGLPGRLTGGTGHAGAFALGVSLGVVWTPCAGPVLGTILTLLATAPDPARAGLLLVCYAAGAGVPMLAIGYGGQAAAVRVRAIARHLPLLQRVFGVLVIAVAVAIALQVDVLATSWLLRFLPSVSLGL